MMQALKRITLTDDGTYLYAVVNFTDGDIFSFGRVCSDNDRDGNCDDEDLDDDNDGILDASECCCVSSLTNGSFESPGISPNPSGYQTVWGSSIPGWDTYGTSNMWVSGPIGSPQSGGKYIELHPSSRIYQTLTLNGASGTLSWSMYHRRHNGSSNAQVSIGPDLSSLTAVQTMSNGDSWTYYSGTYTITAGMTSVVIAIDKLTSGTYNINFY